MIELKTLIAVVVLPALLILIAAAIRYAQKAPQSSATDVFAFIIVFDGAIIVDPEIWAKFVSPSIASSVSILSVISVIVAVLFWAFCLWKLEDELMAHHDEPSLPLAGLAMRWLAVWVACFALIFAHAAVLSGRVSV